MGSSGSETFGSTIPIHRGWSGFPGGLVLRVASSGAGRSGGVHPREPFVGFEYSRADRRAFRPFPGAGPARVDMEGRRTMGRDQARSVETSQGPTSLDWKSS